MTAGTLPGIGTPSYVIFHNLEQVTIALGCVFIVAACMSFILMLYLSLVTALCQKKGCKNCKPFRQCAGPSGCCGWMQTKLLSMGRCLCVAIFPKLFKIHKTRRKESMLFLESKIFKNELPFVAAFCSLILVLSLYP